MKYVLLAILTSLIAVEGCNQLPKIRMSEFTLNADPSFQHSLKYRVYKNGSKYFVDLTVYNGVDHKRNRGVLANVVKELNAETVDAVKAALAKIDFWIYDTSSDVRDGTEISLHLQSFPFYSMRTLSYKNGLNEGLGELVRILHNYTNVKNYQVSDR